MVRTPAHKFGCVDFLPEPEPVPEPVPDGSYCTGAGVLFKRVRDPCY
jgi:hypothetical protein